MTGHELGLSDQGPASIAAIGCSIDNAAPFATWRLRARHLEKLWHLGHVDDINRLTLFVGDDERLRCQVPAVPNGVGQNLPGRTHRYLPGFELVSEVFPFLVNHSLGSVLKQQFQCRAQDIA